MTAEHKVVGIIIFGAIVSLIVSVTIVTNNYIKKGLPQTVNVISIEKLVKEKELNINDADMVLFSMVTLLKNNQIELSDDVKKHIVNETYLLVPYSYFKDKEKE